MVVLGGGAVSYERGTPVAVVNHRTGLQGYLAHKKLLTPLGPP